MVTKETRRIFRIWPQTLLPSVVTTALYFLVFGSFIGSRIGNIGDFSYMQFIVPGLIMMAVILNAYNNVVSVVFSAKFQRNIEELLISPMGANTIILGWVSSGVIRGSLVGGLVWLTSLLFVPFQVANPPLMLITLLLTAIFFSLCGCIAALFAKTFDQMTIIPTFVLTPLIYLGGVFYTISSLSAFWQRVSKFNPILYLINTFRYGFLGVSDIPVSTSLTVLLFVTLTAWIACYYFVHRGMGLRS